MHIGEQQLLGPLGSLENEATLLRGSERRGRSLGKDVVICFLGQNGKGKWGLGARAGGAEVTRQEGVAEQHPS